MTQRLPIRNWKRLVAIAALAWVQLGAGWADGQILSIAFPEPATNAALHYNRALLQLSTIPIAQREVLNRPIWETFGDSTKEEIAARVSNIVFQGRHAIRAALEGSQQRQCNFGIDYSDVGHGAVVPHAPLMMQLARLVTLAGINAQIKGEDEKAAQLFFESMRMGRHMANEPTLLESLVGIEMLENAYFSLAFWATRCQNPQLINDAFTRLELASKSDIQPARTLAYEASIIDRQIDRIIEDYPDGPWAEVLLESWGLFTEAKTKDELESLAKAAAAERGIPAEVFNDKAAFTKAANKHRALDVNYYRDAAICVSLPPKQRAQRAAELMAKYGPQFDAMGNHEFLDVRDIGKNFATHEAELIMARVAMAIAAERNASGYPQNLDAIKHRFGGATPRSPYDSSELEYSVLNDGKDFMVAVPETTYGDIVMPRIEFSSVRRAANN